MTVSYGVEEAEQLLIERTELRMLRRVLGASRVERIRNVETRKVLEWRVQVTR